MTNEFRENFLQWTWFKQWYDLVVRTERAFTFDSDLDDVVCSAQAVCGCAVVAAGVTFNHIGNLQHFIEVLERRPAPWQLGSILLPVDLWSGPCIKCKRIYS